MKKLLLCFAVVLSGLLSGAQAEEMKSVEIEQHGLTLLGRLVVADGANIKDGVVVITHGTMAHMDMELIINMQSLLAERGINSLAHTLSMGISRRTGAYDCSVPVRGTKQEDGADITAWFNWLKAQGATSISLMGHSRGAVQSVAAAADHALDGLSSVIMLAPSAGQSYPDYLANYDKRNKSDISILLAIAKEMISNDKGDQLMDVPGFMYCGATKMSARSLVSHFGAESSKLTKDIIASTDVPVLVVVGVNDKVVGDIATKLAPVLNGDRVQFSWIEDADHFFYDFAAEDAADIITEFLTTQRN